MAIDLSLLLCNACLLLLAFLTAKGYHKIFLGLLFFSHLYFCVGGVFYWIFVRHSLFVGVDWGGDLLHSAFTLSYSTVLVATIVWIGSRLEVGKFREASSIFSAKRMMLLPRDLWILFSLGFLSALFVILAGASGVGFGSFNQSPFFLIALQFSDLLIPTILFLIVSRGWTGLNNFLVLMFMAFAIVVGLRYKIALIAIPIVFEIWFSNLRTVRKLSIVSIGGSGILILFSIMTLFRQKFSGLNFDVLHRGENSGLLYGFFAETNILFGLSSILKNYVEAGRHFLFDPIIDTMAAWLPHFLFPDRLTGAYLIGMKIGLGTNEGYNSGTTYPFVGEFAIMGGWIGIILGCFVFSFAYLGLFKLLSVIAPNKRYFLVGVSLLAATMGYYHYSRGYLPQAVKGYIFVIFPYLYLCARATRSKLLS